MIEVRKKLTLAQLELENKFANRKKMEEYVDERKTKVDRVEKVPTTVLRQTCKKGKEQNHMELYSKKAKRQIFERR